MPNALQVLNPPNQNQLYLILNNAGYSQPNPANALGLNQYQGRPLMVVREDQLQNALGAAPGFSPGELETNALRAMDLGGNIGTSMMPGMGDVRDLGEAIGGNDWWTGQQLTGPERWMSAGAAAIPFVGMGMGRAIGQATAPFAEDLKRAIQTPEFKNWFGKSVVVDETGEPMAVYHGTKADFAEFSPDRIGANADSGWWGRGHYFTPDPGIAEQYAKHGRLAGAQKTMPVFLNINRPFVFDATSSDSFNKTKAEAARIGAELNNFNRPADPADFTSRAIAGGYDGAILRYDGYPAEYVAFSPNQIKSIWNRGTWDPNKPEISW